MSEVRRLSTKEFTSEYAKRVGAQDYLTSVREMSVGMTLAIPAAGKAEARRKQHGIINDASRRRKAGQMVRIQTILNAKEVWVRRIE